MSVVLAACPHPDDDVLGAGPLLLDLMGRGHEVHVWFPSLGRPADQNRRFQEVTHAADLAGWVLHLQFPGLDSRPSEAAVTYDFKEVQRRVNPDVVLGPSPHDAHPFHETLGRVIRDSTVSRWWVWRLWGHLPAMNLIHPFTEETMIKAKLILEAYAGELARSDYADLLVGRARLDAALSSERVFGFGTARGFTESYALAFSALTHQGDAWVADVPRVLDLGLLLGGTTGQVASWVAQPSPYLQA